VPDSSREQMLNSLPCPALPCPALPCPALPGPARPCLMFPAGVRHLSTAAADHHHSAAEHRPLLQPGRRSRTCLGYGLAAVRGSSGSSGPDAAAAAAFSGGWDGP
jgi:hypothetical protein